MKVYDVISESVEVDEAPAGWLAQKARGLGAKLGSKSSATTLATGNEANSLKSELRAWMKGSKIPSGGLTPEDLETYLDQKGYGGIAKPILDKMRSGAAAKSIARDARTQAAGYKVGQAAGAISRAAGAAGAAIKNAAGVNPPPPVSEAPVGMPPAPGGPSSPIGNSPSKPLTNREVDQVLASVVAQAYKTGAGFEKGRFGKDKAAPAPAASTSAPVDLNTVDPKDAKLIMALKQKGYNVVK